MSAHENKPQRHRSGSGWVKKALFLSLFFWGAAAWAQALQAPQASLPAGSVLRLIVPFTPGTGIDLIALTVGPRLAERLGHPVVVDNRLGVSLRFQINRRLGAKPQTVL